MIAIFYFFEGVQKIFELRWWAEVFGIEDMHYREVRIFFIVVRDVFFLVESIQSESQDHQPHQKYEHTCVNHLDFKL